MKDIIIFIGIYIGTALLSIILYKIDNNGKQ